MEQNLPDLIPYEQAGQTNAQQTNDQEQLFIQLIVDIVITKGNKNKSFGTEERKEMYKKLYIGRERNII